MKRFRFSDAIEKVEARPMIKIAECSRMRVEVSRLLQQ
jgi:hypothetical protein